MLQGCSSVAGLQRVEGLQSVAGLQGVAWLQQCCSWHPPACALLPTPCHTELKDSLGQELGRVYRQQSKQEKHAYV